MYTVILKKIIHISIYLKISNVQPSFFPLIQLYIIQLIIPNEYSTLKSIFLKQLPNLFEIKKKPSTAGFLSSL